MITQLILAMLIFFAAMIPAAFAQSTGTIEVFIKSENNDRVFPEGISIKVFKDLEKTTTQEILSLQNNPFIISSLPLGHRYGVEVYINNMYAGTGFVDLQQGKQNLEITVKNTGGMRLNVFYKDGQTPLSDAYVAIKSHDGKTWHTSTTDQFGNSIRAWLYPSIKDGNYYYAEISLAPGLKFTTLPIKLQPSVAQEFKIITTWPTVVDKLFTIEVYNSTKTKVTKQDGEFVAQLFDSKKNKIAESLVTDKGLAHFSKLKVNNYVLYIKSKDGAKLETVASKKVVITETTDTIKIYINNPELNSDHLNCNCVAFRLDDVQDYFLAPAQLAVLSLFEQKGLPLTIGVIGGVIGTDQNLITTIKAGLASDRPIEIASHSWNNKVMTSLTKKDQNDLIVKTNDKIVNVFGVKPKTFIPPENVFNNDTLSVLKSNEFTHISYDVREAEPPPFKKSDFYHFPIATSTASLDATTGVWHHLSNEQIVDKIEQSLFDYGYAVVMMHPYEFSVYENGFYVNKVNTTKVKELESLLETIQSKNLKILPIGSIQDYDKSLSVTTPENKTEAPNCNCLAFRLDNIQDYWLNNVQNTLLDTFERKQVPLTIAVLGKFVGDDPKAIDHIKEKLDGNANMRIANRGWEHVDHTSYNVDRQASSIRQTNEKINKIFGVTPTIFVPPYDDFNQDTVEAVKQNKMLYLSSNVAKEKLPLTTDTPRHIPSTESFANLISDDPFLSGTISEKALQKVRSGLARYGFAVISMQPSDFAVKTDEFQNEMDAKKLHYLEQLIDDARASGINIVLLEKVPMLLDESTIVIPDWIKNNAAWWAQDKIGDADFTKGLEYLIEQKIIKIPSTQQGDSIGQKIPSWIKTNAAWWAEGKIGNSDFVKGIQYLIQKGIITI